MKTVMLNRFKFFVLMLCMGLLLPLNASADRAQQQRLYLNAKGDLRLVGNMLMHCTGTGTACVDARNGGNRTNGDGAITMGWVNTDPGAGLTNSSSANFNLPAGATVEWAGLYWGSRYTGTLNSTTHGRIQLKRPGSSTYQLIQSTTLDSATNGYQAFAEVTSIVKSAGGGTYWAGGLTGTTDSGNWAGWTLVIVYSHPSLPLRNFAVYDGFGYISNQTVTANPSGFLTPLAGPVVSRVGVLLWDGDKGSSDGERFLINNYALSDAVNPVGDIWNSTVSYLGSHVATRNPSYANTLGVDLDIVNVPVGVVPNGSTSATVGIKSPGSNEVFWFGVVTFMTDIYEPVVIPNVVKTFEDLTPATPLLVGDTIRWHITMNNTGYDGATLLQATDVIPPYLTYVPGSLVVDTGANTGGKTDAAGDDQAEYLSGPDRIIVRLGAGANATQGGLLAYGQATSFYFDTTVNAGVPAGTLLTNEVMIQHSGQTIQGTTFAASAAAVTATVMGPPAIAKAFSPSSVDVGQTAVMTITVSNAATNPAALTNVSFSDTYPAGLVNTANPNATVSCTPGSTAGTLSGAAANGNTIGMSGATIAAGGSCSITLNVTSHTAGTYLNTTSAVTASNTGAGNVASAQLAVGKPRISKSFSPTSVVYGAPSTLTLVLQNITNQALANVAFSDPLTNMQVAATPAVSNTCGGTVTAAPAGSAISLANGSLPANGSCTVSVNVTSSTMGIQPNTASGVSSDQTGSAGNPSNVAELTVIAPPVLQKSFMPMSVRPNTPTTLTLVLSNPNATTTVNGASFSDVYSGDLVNATPANAAVSCTAGSSATLTGGSNGGNSVGLTSATLAAGGQCVVTVEVQAATTGNKLNTTGSITTTNAGTGLPASATLVVDNRLGIAKSFSPAIVNLDSQTLDKTSTLTITVSNSGAGTINNINFEDVFPTGMYIASPTVGGDCAGTKEGRMTFGGWGGVAVGNTAFRLSGANLSGASCTVTLIVASNIPGQAVNTIPVAYSDNGGTALPASASLTVIVPPTVSKTFNASSVSVSANSNLTLSVTNNATASMVIGWEDIFPSGLVVGDSTSTRSCTNPTSTPGNSTFQSYNGSTWSNGMASGRVGIRVNNLTLQPGQTCTFQTTANSSTSGNYLNTTATVNYSSAGGAGGPEGSGGTASATLSVGQVSVVKTMSTTSVTNAVKQNTNATMTLQLVNQTGSMQNMTLIDDFPGQTPTSGAFTLGSTSIGGATGTCSGVSLTGGYTGSNNQGTFTTAAVGNTGIRLQGNVPTSGCTITLQVRGTETLTNTINAGQLTAGSFSNGSPTNATLYVLHPLVLDKEFDKSTMGLNDVTTMKLTITNLNGVAATDVAFTDQFPAGLAVNGAATKTCNGTLQGSTNGLSWHAVAVNDTWLRLTGTSTLAQGSYCEIEVPVKGVTAGTKTNTISNLTSTNFGDSPAASATVNVLAAPTLTKSFSPDMVLQDEVSTLTLLINNSNAVAVHGIAVTDNYPAGLVNTSSPNATTSCVGGSVTAVAGSSSLSLSGASLVAGGSCSVTVNVSSATLGNYVNTTNAITTANAGTGSTATATLRVVPHAPAPELLKTVVTISDPVNGATSPKAIPGARSRYTLRVRNSGLGSIDNNTVIVTDPLPAGVELYVGAGAPSGMLAGFSFQDGTPSSGLACTFGARNNGSDCVDFSTDGLSFNYTPSPDPDGFDANVKAIRFRPTGGMNPYSAGSPWAEFSFEVRLK